LRQPHASPFFHPLRRGMIEKNCVRNSNVDQW
jgi:hypothetical protein